MTAIEMLAKEIHEAQELLGKFAREQPGSVETRPLTPNELAALRLVVRCAIVPRETWNTMVTSFEESTQLREHLRSFIGVH